MFRVGLIKCGSGNIKSMENALLRADFTPILVSEAIELKTVDADLIVLPGVGAFGHVMEQLRRRGLIEELERKVLDCKVPFLGVCVGMQILATTASEHGEHEGLGWIEGTVNKIQINSDNRLPHVGWNCLEPTQGKFLEKFAGQDFYFVHSNAIMCSDAYIAARSTYGNTFVSAVQKENIFGVQFHPEKSSSLGEYFFSCLAKKVKNIA